MTDALIEAVARAICQSAIDENAVAVKAPLNGMTFGRNFGGDQHLWHGFTTDAEAALAAIESAGFVLVAKEPTEQCSFIAVPDPAYGMASGLSVPAVKFCTLHRSYECEGKVPA